MQDKILKLTSTVYKVLEFFPESDPLKNRAKDKALSIMENPNPEDIDMLLGYLWIGKSQGWLNSANYLILVSEYEKIRKGIEPITELTQKLPGIDNKPASPDFYISNRQGQILDFLTKNEKAQVMDLQTILPNITKRTIRRDLDELLEAGKIVRMGDFNQVFYELNDGTNNN